MSFYVLRNSTTLMIILLFSSKAFCHLRTKYIHLHLGFPAKYLHTGECRCDQHLVELHTQRDVCFLLSWAPTGGVSHSLSAKASGTYRRNVCWAFVPAWDADEAMLSWLLWNITTCYSPGLCSLFNGGTQDSCQEKSPNKQRSWERKSANQSRHLMKSTGTFETPCMLL